MTSAQVADPDFPTVAGFIRAQALVNGVLYVGGSFDLVGGTRTGFSAAFDPGSATPLPSWPFVDGAVFAIAPDGGGGWYLGGEFTSVAGVARDHLAHVRADGSLDAWAPRANWGVNEIVVEDSIVYLGGSFTLINGQSRHCLAAVDARDGDLLPWTPDVGGGVSAIVVADSTIYVGGWFTQVGGRPRDGLAAIDAVSGDVRPWTPGTDAPVLCMLRRGGRLFVGGNFTTLGGVPRPYLGAVDLSTGLPLDWAPGASTTVHALACCDSTLYVGGSFLSIGGQPRVALAAFDLESLELSPWNPDPNGYVAGLAIVGDSLYAGGDFTTVGGRARNHIAAFARAGGALLDWDPGLNEDVSCIGTDGTTLRVGGLFWTSGGLRRAGLAAIDAWTGEVLPWNPGLDGSVWALKGSGATLFVAGEFGRIDGLPRHNVASVDAASGVVLPWAPDVQPMAWALAVSPSAVFVGGSDLVAGGEARHGIAALDRASGSVLPLSPDPEGSHIAALAVVDTTLFAGGWFATPLPDPGGYIPWGYLARIGLGSGEAGTYGMGRDGRVVAILPGPYARVYVGGSFSDFGISRSHLVALDARTGVVLPWTANVSGNGVASLAEHGGTLYLGGEFQWAGGGQRDNLAAFEVVSGALTDWNPGADDQVRSIVADEAGVFVAGDFRRIGGLFQPNLARLLDASGFRPPDATVLAPSPGEILESGSSYALRWSAGSGLPRVQSVDLSLSRSGPSGPWELIAAGVRNTGEYEWTVSGPACADQAWLRVDARDFAGNLASALGSGAFSISDVPVPALIELFHAEETPEGVSIEWRVSQAGAFARLGPERGAAAVGEFSPVSATPTIENGTSRVLDRDAAPGRTWWYRLAGTLRDGGGFATAPLAVGGGAAVTSFSLAPLAPNPTSGVSTLSFAVPVRARVRLSLLDVQGREVAVLADGERAPGRHVAALDARDMRPGLYFVRMQAPGADLRRRVAIVR